MDIGKGLNKKYLTLITDSIELIEQAESLGDEISSVFYRASIVSNILAVECCANICIQQMDLPDYLYENVEKMSVVGKFEYYAYHSFNRIIDKTLNEYANLKSLINVRNNYVHPKVEEGEYKIEIGEFQFGRGKSFNMSNDIRIWAKEDAVALLNAHVNFMNYYFNKVCAYKTGQSNTLLTTLEKKLSQELVETFIGVNSDTHKKINKYLTETISYMDIRKLT